MVEDLQNQLGQFYMQSLKLASYTLFMEIIKDVKQTQTRLILSFIVTYLELPQLGPFCDNNVVNVFHLLNVVTKTSVLEIVVSIRHWLPFPFYKRQKSDKAAVFLLFHLTDLDRR